jgi:hypothetical protein
VVVGGEHFFPKGENVHYFIAGATLCEAAYEAFDSPEAEKSPNVQFSRKSGLMSVSIIDKRAPPDVIEELADGQNEFNQIAGASSFMELYVKSQEIEHKFLEKRRDDRKRKIESIDGAGGAGGSNDAPKVGYEVEYREWFMPKFAKKFNNSFEFYKEFRVTQGT